MCSPEVSRRSMATLLNKNGITIRGQRDKISVFALPMHGCGYAAINAAPCRVMGSRPSLPISSGVCDMVIVFAIEARSRTFSHVATLQLMA